MRGKLSKRACRELRARITPADAGKTHTEKNADTDGQDHPRGCGENCPLSGAHGLTLGSPPRMRGKPELANSASAAVGITPADAGKTLNATCFTSMTWDHPRGCGENAIAVSIHRTLLGSPPRMRGKHNPIKQAQKKIRITPADAGKTWTMEHLPKMDEDHPRGCGENTKKIL